MRFGLREAAFLLLLLAMPAGSFLGLFQPRNEKMAVARTERQAKEAKLKQYHEATASFDNLPAQVREIESATRKVEQQIPADPKEAEAYHEWAEIARSHQLLMEFNASSKVVGPMWNEYPKRMTLTGDFDDFYAFIRDVTEMGRLSQIKQLNVQRLQDKDANGRIEAEFTLSIFSEKTTGA